MRWIWIDKIVEHEPGRRMVAIKNVSRAEQHLRDHFPGNPVMPASLIIEGMAQTAGILVGGANDFKEKVILAKIVRATLDTDVVPGQSLRYTATVERLDRQGCSTHGVVERFARPDTAWREIGRIDLIFSHLDQNASGLRFPEENFVFTDEIFSLLADM